MACMIGSAEKFSVPREGKDQHLEGKRYAGSGPQSPHFSSSSSGWRGCVAWLLGQQQGLWWDWGTVSIPLKKHQSLCGPGPNLPPRAENPSAAAFMVDLKHPQALRKKPLSVSETPYGIQDVSPPEIFLDKIRATAEPLPSYNPSHAHDLWTSLWAVTLKGGRMRFKGKNAHHCITVMPSW